MTTKIKKYIVALDQGTTSCRSILFDENQKIVAVEQKEFKQIMPQSGWVEHDPIEILETQKKTLKDLILKSDLNPVEIAAIGITNQRETTVIWNKKTGTPIYNAIVWQDNRTKEFCEKLIKENNEELINNKTGLVIDSYFSSTKIKWILENVSEAKVLLENDQLLFGTIDTWLIWNLTGNHYTDVTNASRTQLFNIHSLNWDNDLLAIFNIPNKILPTVKESSDDFGTWKYNGTTIPITGVAGDQQAALFGQKCTKKGMAKNTYGTGCFMLMNTAGKAVKSDNGLLTTIAWSIDGQINYALEGSVFIAGAAIQWLRDALKIINNAAESEKLAQESNNEDIIFIPAFSGLGAPYWKMNVKGSIFGITRDSGINDICKATLQSLALQSRDLLVAMEKDAGFKLEKLAVDGGACKNNYLMQFQADILNNEVIRPKNIESTALGAALLAGIKVNFYKNEITHKNDDIDQSFYPGMNEEFINEKIKNWENSIKCLINMYE